jgi:hypothetical protein
VRNDAIEWIALLQEIAVPNLRQERDLIYHTKALEININIER